MTRTSTQDLQEDFLAALRKGQQTMIGALRIWVETVQAVTPKLSGVYTPLTDKLPQLPSVGVPFAGKLPSPKEAVDGAYGLVEALLANQRDFAEAVLDTAAPLMPGQKLNGRNYATPKVAPKPVLVRTEPSPAETKPAAVVPAPQRVVAKPELQAKVVATQPKPPVATTPKAAEAEAKAAEAKAAEAKAATPKAAAPKAAAPKAAAPATPKATPRKAAPRKAAPRKAAAPKATAPKATAPRAKSPDAS